MVSGRAAAVRLISSKHEVSIVQATVSFVMVLVLSLPCVAQQHEPAAGTGATPAPPLEPAPKSVGPSDNPLHPRVLFQTTIGDMVFELNAEKAPITVQNFIQYVEDGYYEGTIFHRVIKDFIVQAGGFTPELKEKKEGLRDPIPSEWPNGLENLQWAIAAARLNDHVDSATSQFFINLSNNMPLDLPRDGAGYCVFGKVIAGFDTLEKMQQVKLHKHPNYPQRTPVTPVTPIVVTKASLIGDFDRDKVAELLDKNRKALAAVRQARLDKMNKELDAYTAKLEDETGKKVQTTESGLRYIVLSPGDGASPEPGDQVTVHYTGWLLDGTKFNSSVDKGQPEQLILQPPLPAGWIEGLCMMKLGGKRKLIIPNTLAFGGRARGMKIPAYASLVFDVELLGVTKAADLPANPKPKATPRPTPQPKKPNPFERKVEKKKKGDS